MGCGGLSKRTFFPHKTRALCTTLSAVWKGPLGLPPIRTEFPGISSAPSHELIPNPESQEDVSARDFQDHKSELDILKGPFPAHTPTLSQRADPLNQALGCRSQTNRC